MRIDPATVRRRRLFAAMLVVLLTVLVVELVHLPGSSPGASTGRDRGTRRPDGTMPPVYVAWMPGGFSPSFRAAVAAVPGLASTVVVAGDTRWLTASHAASGAEVDRPTPPYRIPIDAFAVDPTEYAPFMPPGYRDEVVATLAKGEAVLGTTSAAIRRLGVGGRLSFGPTSVTVGAVVPNAVVGWSELLVSRTEGARLGVIDDRYLLARTTTKLSDAALLASLRPLLPQDTPVRVAAPGEVRYVRVASGSAPPVVLKEAFGEFAAYPDAANPIRLHIDPAWFDAHVLTRTVPVLGRETCNRAFFPALEGAMQELQRDGLASLVKSNAGCYNPELLARLPTAPPAFHAYGAAIDINAPENAFGAKPTQDLRLVAVLEHWGMNWGGTFLVPDGMHFEYGSPAPRT